MAQDGYQVNSAIASTRGAYQASKLKNTRTTPQLSHSDIPEFFRYIQFVCEEQIKKRAETKHGKSPARFLMSKNI
ncbi:MAG: hypothetical protein AAGF75_10550 [Cyanobacteria bacterium P01_H01_bin.130]